MAEKSKDGLGAALKRICRVAKAGMSRWLRRRRASVDDVRGFLTDLYAGVLGRQPDADGMSNHLRRLGSNPTFMDARDVLAAFVNSQEARAKHGRGPASLLPIQNMEVQPAGAIISLGTHCLTSMTLKKFGLKQFSGPFDWIFSNPAMVAHCIEDDFRTFLDRDQHEFIPPEKRDVPSANFCDHLFYRDQYGISTMFNHHDITDPAIYAYYERCVDRFRTAIRADHRTLLVMVAAYHSINESDFRRLCAAMEPFEQAEMMIVRVAKSPGKFGGELLAEQGRHKFHELNLIGEFGTLGFTEQCDDAMFRYMLDSCLVELAPTIV